MTRLGWWRAPEVVWRRREVAVWLAISVLSVVAAGQAPPISQEEEVRNLDFLIGEWKGEGWELGPDGTRQGKFSQKTKIQTKIQGKEKTATLRVKEERTYEPIISTRENPIFIPGTPIRRSSTLDATIYYDDDLKLYRWRGENSFARKSPLEAKLIGDRTLQYGMPFSVLIKPDNGYRKTTIQVTEAGDLLQTLEVWNRGRWNKVEESVLTRVK